MRKLLSKFSLRTKLFMLTLNPIILSVVMGYIGQNTLVKVGQIVQTMQDRNTAIDAMATAGVDTQKFAVLLWAMGNKAMSQGAIRPDMVDLLKKESENVGKSLKDLNGVPGVTGKDKDTLNEMIGKYNEAQPVLAKAFATLVKPASRKAIEDDVAAAAGRVTEISGKVSAVRSGVFDGMLELVLQAVNPASNNRNLTYTVFFLMAVVAVAGYFFSRRLGLDLVEVGKSLETAAQEIQGTSQTIAVIGQQLSEITTEQSAAVEETVASMEEMSSMMGQTSNNAQNAMRSATETQTKADEGGKTIGSLKESMEEISHANERLEEINRVIEEINEKTKVINDIVAETRMLSFNASIEAARAGEHGRGFAVVAEQIGSLAKMSGKAAQEIRVLINKSTAQVNSSISFTQDKVKAGQRISEECAGAFSKITETLRQLNPLVNAIGSAASQQETGIAQTNKAMQQMDIVTNKNMKRASEAAHAGTRLENQYGILANTVQRLNEVIFGNKAGMTSTSSSQGGGGWSGNAPTGGGSDEGSAMNRVKKGLASVTKLVPKDKGEKGSSKQDDPATMNAELPHPDDTRFGT